MFLRGRNSPRLYACGPYAATRVYGLAQNGNAYRLPLVAGNASRFAATPVETAERTAERLRVCNPQSESLYVAIHKQQVVGYGALRWWNSLILPGPDAYLSELFVLPDYRSQGIGSALLLRLRQDAVAQGSTRLWCINLRNRDSYLRGYYKKSGWEEKDIAVFFDTLDH